MGLEEELNSKLGDIEYKIIRTRGKILALYDRIRKERGKLSRSERNNFETIISLLDEAYNYVQLGHTFEELIANITKNYNLDIDPKKYARILALSVINVLTKTDKTFLRTLESKIGELDDWITKLAEELDGLERGDYMQTMNSISMVATVVYKMANELNRVVNSVLENEEFKKENIKYIKDVLEVLEEQVTLPPEQAIKHLDNLVRRLRRY